MGETIMPYVERDLSNNIVGVFSTEQYPGQEFLANGAVDLKPIAQEAKWQEIKAYRDKVKGGGVLVSTKWFHTDDASRIQQLGLVMMGATLPAGIMWKTMDGTFIEMTQQLAADIFSAVSALDVAAFANAETHRQSMLLNADPANYDYSTGWPTTYLYG